MPATSRTARSGRVRSESGRSGSPSKSSSTQPRPSTCEHLTEVVVAVDPLQRRPARVDGRVEDRRDTRARAPRARAPRDAAAT